MRHEHCTATRHYKTMDIHSPTPRLPLAYNYSHQSIPLISHIPAQLTYNRLLHTAARNRTQSSTTKQCHSHFTSQRRLPHAFSCPPEQSACQKTAFIRLHLHAFGSNICLVNLCIDISFCVLLPRLRSNFYFMCWRSLDKSLKRARNSRL